jgi:hypothetical protein
MRAMMQNSCGVVDSAGTSRQRSAQLFTIDLQLRQMSLQFRQVSVVAPQTSQFISVAGCGGRASGVSFAMWVPRYSQDFHAPQR